MTTNFQNRLWRTGISVLFIALLASSPASSQVTAEKCRGVLFSTSEDFTMQESEPPDGNPIISDGDLLQFVPGVGTKLCLRNAQLIRQFDITGVDLGLDAFWAITPRRNIIAFSTELDSVHGQFTAGDLLFNDGLIIPNAALLDKFNVPKNFDMGLDAVTITGQTNDILAALKQVRTVGLEGLRQKPEALRRILEEHKVDILFSTEGTAPLPEKPKFIDGDLLSVVNGTIVRPNSVLLSGLPAGIPHRGADFGLDAYTLGIDPETTGVVELLSTEIVGRGRQPFTDGDALLLGPSVRWRNAELLKSFAPVTFDLGLDALDLALPPTACANPLVTHVNHVPVSDPSGQFIEQANPASRGLATTAPSSVPNTLRPFGGMIRIQGAMPVEAGCPDFNNLEFRVELSDDVTAFPAIGDPNTLANPGNWTQHVDIDPTVLIDCKPRLFPVDASGWIRMSDYARWIECANGSGASLAVWNSSSLATGMDPADPPVRLRFRVVARQIGAGVATHVGPAIWVTIDNTNYDLPTSKTAPLTGDINLTLAAAPASGVTVDDCKVEGDANKVLLSLNGRMRDTYFSHYTLRWTGGNAIGWHNIVSTLDNDFDGDGSDRSDLSLKGTEPQNDVAVPLSIFNLTDAHKAATAGSELPVECGYTIELRAFDRTVVGRFNPVANVYWTTRRWKDYPISFCFKPQ
ncbi:MAG: hypothetical protein GY948_12770 [Alphaproteobacteria bacterium]|nr:hypothetical protein [Alphaproteobacteria bacterium]